MESCRVIRGKMFLTIAVFILTVLVCAGYAHAEEPGWNQKGSKIWYIQEDGMKATGLVKIGNYFYSFRQNGNLRTGWVKYEEGYRYFRPAGQAGVRGRMLTSGIRKIGLYKYGFGEDGLVLTGFVTVNNRLRYFNTSEKRGVRGQIVTNKWVKDENGRKLHLNAKGIVDTNRWVGQYYVQGDGTRLKNAIMDGYLLRPSGRRKKLSTGWVKIQNDYYFYNARGKKVYKDKLFKYKRSRYYVNAEGVRMTGWQTVGSDTYYFDSNGKAFTGTHSIDGVTYTFSSSGVRQDTTITVTGTKAKTGKASILILCGHGQGDPGASNSTWGQEQNYTREFGTLIFSALRSSGAVNADLFNTRYDMYQQLKKTLNATSYDGGTLQAAIKGNGNLGNRTYTATRENPVVPDLRNYDYILEIHFDAGVLKPSKADGVRAGCSILVNSYKSNTTIDTSILNYLVGSGAKRHAGLTRRSDLLNARVMNEIGVSYGLLETCFIDDYDDMKYYKNHKGAMAEAVANAVIAYFR